MKTVSARRSYSKRSGSRTRRRTAMSFVPRLLPPAQILVSVIDILVRTYRYLRSLRASQTDDSPRVAC